MPGEARGGGGFGPLLPTVEGIMAHHFFGFLKSSKVRKDERAKAHLRTSEYKLAIELCHIAGEDVAVISIKHIPSGIKRYLGNPDGTSLQTLWRGKD